MSKPNRPHVQVYILSYNRPEYIEQTLESVLSQDYSNFEVIVSDNSTTEDVFKALESSKFKGRFKYVRRSPSLRVLDHINKVISEVTSDYFMMFHDDDVMKPTLLTKLMRFLLSMNNLAAVGCNAHILRENKFSNKKFNPYMQGDLIVNSPAVLAQHYMISRLGHVPFPSYLYKKSAVQNIILEWKKGQKHADVVFLLEILRKGSIGWINDCEMHYRRHGSNDSNSIDPKAIVSLCRYIHHHVPVSEKLIYDFKHKHFLLWVKQKRKNAKLTLTPWRDRVIYKSANKFALTHVHLILRYLLRNLFSPQSS